MNCRYLKFYLCTILNFVIIIFYIKLLQNIKESGYVGYRNKINVDQRSEPARNVINQRIAKHIPYLPIEDLGTVLNSYRSHNFTCAWYPSIMDIKIHNEYWQIFYNRNLTYSIFGAYLDTRFLKEQNKIHIRLLAMIDLITPNADSYPQAYCQLWFRETILPVIVPIKKTQFIWQYVWGHDPHYSFPHILTCDLPKKYHKLQPKSVSLVAKSCDKPTNLLRVIYRPLNPLEKKKDFAVCIKFLDFPFKDMSYRFVEYMETLKALGAQQVTMYKLEVHPNITKVLEYYERTGFLEYRPFSFSLQHSNLPEYRHLQINTELDAFILHEGIAYNDCIYRNMYRFKYIAVWDVDELVVPLKNNRNWGDLAKIGENIKTAKCKNSASFCFYCTYFPNYENNFTLSTKYPEYFYMLQHVRRTRDHARFGTAMKCFHKTDYIIATHTHFPVHHKADCRYFVLPKSEAQLNHYREPPFKENLTNPVIDKSLRRFGSEIIKKSMEIFGDLNFFLQN